MLGKRNPQQGLWESWIYDRLIPQDHLLMKIDRLVDFSFVEEETRDLYSVGVGRPSYPPEQLFRMLLLAYLYDLSDVRVAEEIRYNLLFRAFCGFGLYDETPDDTTLVVFRERLGEERFERLFDRLLQQIVARGLLKGRRKVVDATFIQAAAAMKNRAELLRQGRRRVLKELARTDPEGAERLAAEEEACPEDLSRDERLRWEEERTAASLKELQEVQDDSVAYWRRQLAKVLEGEGGVASFTDP